MGFRVEAIPGLRVPGEGKTLRQIYDKEPGVEGALIMPVTLRHDDVGQWFKEIMRVNENGVVEECNLKVRQANASKIAPGAKRFWHVHPKQNEMWTPDGTLLVGLIDLREASPTYEMRQRVILSNDKKLYIPAGVAHGFLNPNAFCVLLNYVADHQFEVMGQEFRVEPNEYMPIDWVAPEIM